MNNLKPQTKTVPVPNVESDNNNDLSPCVSSTFRFGSQQVSDAELHSAVKALFTCVAPPPSSTALVNGNKKTKKKNKNKNMLGVQLITELKSCFCGDVAQFTYEKHRLKNLFSSTLRLQDKRRHWLNMLNAVDCDADEIRTSDYIINHLDFVGLRWDLCEDEGAGYDFYFCCANDHQHKHLTITFSKTVYRSKWFHISCKYMEPNICSWPARKPLGWKFDEPTPNVRKFRESLDDWYENDTDEEAGFADMEREEDRKMYDPSTSSSYPENFMGSQHIHAEQAHTHKASGVQWFENAAQFATQFKDSVKNFVSFGAKIGKINNFMDTIIEKMRSFFAFIPGIESMTHMINVLLQRMQFYHFTSTMICALCVLFLCYILFFVFRVKSPMLLSLILGISIQVAQLVAPVIKELAFGQQIAMISNIDNDHRIQVTINQQFTKISYNDMSYKEKEEFIKEVLEYAKKYREEGVKDATHVRKTVSETMSTKAGATATVTEVTEVLHGDTVIMADEIGVADTFGETKVKFTKGLWKILKLIMNILDSKVVAFMKQHYNSFVKVCKDVYSISQGLAGALNIYQKMQAVWNWVADEIHHYYYGYPRSLSPGKLHSLYLLSLNMITNPTKYELPLFHAVQSQIKKISIGAKDCETDLAQRFSNISVGLERGILTKQDATFKMNRGLVAPFVVCMRGKSGTHKSTTVDAMATAICVALSGDENFRSVHFRNPDIDHWDTYDNQLVDVRDDFGQGTDSEANPNKSFIELIGSKNIAHYVLPMASLEEKGKIYSSPIILLTTNMEQFVKETVKSIICPEAISNRIEIMFHVLEPGKFQLEKCFGMTNLQCKGTAPFTPDTITPFVLDIFALYYNAKAQIQADVEQRFKDSIQDWTPKKFDTRAWELVQRLIQCRKSKTDSMTRDIYDQLYEGIEVMHSIDEITARVRSNLQRIDPKMDVSDMIEVLENAYTNVPPAVLSPPPNLVPKPSFETSLAASPSLFKRAYNTFKKTFKLTRCPLHECAVTCDYKQLCLDVCLQRDQVFPIDEDSPEVLYYKDTLTDEQRTAMCVGNLNILDEMEKLPTVEDAPVCIYDFILENKVKRAEMGIAKHYLPWVRKMFVYNEATEIVKIRAIIGLDVNVYRFLATKMKFLTDELQQKWSASLLIRSYYFNDKAENFNKFKSWISANGKIILGTVLGIAALFGMFKLAHVLYQMSLPGDADSVTYNPKGSRERSMKYINRAIVNPDIGKAQSASEVVSSLQQHPDFESLYMNPADRSIDTTARDMCFNLVYQQCYLRRKRGLYPLNAATFLDTRTFLTTGHTLSALSNEDDIIFIFPHRGVTFDNCTVRFKDCKVYTIRDSSNEHDIDAVVVRIPEANQVPRMKSMWNKFVPMKDMQYYANRKCTILGIHSNNDKYCPLLIDQASVKIEAKRYSYIAEDQHGGVRTIELPEYITYEHVGYKGACGSLVQGQNATTRGGPERLIGMHCAVNANGTRGHAVVLSAETMVMAKEYLDKSGIAFGSAQGAGGIGSVAINWKLMEVEEPKVDLAFIAGFEPTGRGLNSHIIVSKIGEMGIFPMKKAPAKLKAECVNGEWIDPNVLALRKFEHPIYQPAHKEILEFVIEEYSSLIITENRFPTQPSLLTIEEAVFGVPGDPFLKGLKMTTSLGWPWKVLYPGKGKHSVIRQPNPQANDPGWIHPVLRAAVENRIASYRRGELPETIFEDHLKDEKRPKEKVALFKTRLFSAAPIDLTIVMRMYFGKFISHMMHNHVHNEQGVGINPTGPGWDALARKLMKYGDHMIAGDLTNIDATEPREFLWGVKTVVNNWYNMPEDDIVRSGCHHDTISATHLNRGVKYVVWAANPSGGLMTAFNNGIMLNLALRYIYYVNAREANVSIMKYRFNDMVSPCVFGDDNVMGVAPEAHHYYNPSSVSNGFSRFGMTYTSEKDKNSQNDSFRTIGEVSFLKREFFYDENEKMYIGRLDLDTILEIVNWTYDDVGNDELIAGCEQAIRELALHPPAVYSKYSRLIVDAVRRAKYGAMVISSQYMYRESMLRGVDLGTEPEYL